MRDFNDTTAGSVPSPDFHSAIDGFLSTHGNGLARVISAIGNRNARTVLQDLEEEIGKAAPDQDFLQFLIEALQEFLLEPPRSALDGFPVPPDLDAAVRWHLSKLSDLPSVRRK
ncbi:hypothetical protein [Tropicimonas aquimaris]|uniref:CdiI immunity protein domain-containing protein n=1 Tax=Tropicimonas aquimaris TaxID=914152 RepID=A0ABW3IJX2_9RHOB